MCDYKRKSFAKIVLQNHPDSSMYNFTKNSKLEPNQQDIRITNEIIDIVKNGHDYFGRSDGEWSYLDSVKRSNYIQHIKQENFNLFFEIFCNMFRNDSTYGLVTPSFSEVKQDEIKNQILLDLDTCYEFTRLNNIEIILFNSKLGNPFGLIFNDKILFPDTPRHYYFAEKITDILSTSDKKEVLEIGGGYGGLSLMLKRINYNSKYLIVDLFETCLIQYYFLKKAGLNVEFVLDENHQVADPKKIYIIPTSISDPILKRLDNIGIVFNSRSFSEMSKRSIECYFSLIQKDIKPNFIYHENSNFLLFPNSERHIEILGSDFPIDSNLYCLKYLCVSPFLGGSGRYRVFLYEKKNYQNS